MLPVLRIVQITSFIVAFSIAAPVALADDLPPAQGLSSRGASQGFSDDRSRNGWASQRNLPNQRAADSWAGRSERVGPERRARNLMRRGLKAEKQGNMTDACGYYQQARQAFIQARSSGGANHSDIQIARTCNS